MTRQEPVGKAEHRSVKHFVSAGRELQAAKERFERQQFCLMRRGKVAAQKALDALPKQPDIDLCLKITATTVPLQTKKGVIDLVVHLARTARSGEMHHDGVGPTPSAYAVNQFVAQTKKGLERFGNFMVTVNFQN